MAEISVTRRDVRDFAEQSYLPALAEGLMVTARHFWNNLMDKNRVPTVSYPDEPVEYAPRFRGQHRLVRREDGSTKCVACFMCQTACPANCITIVAGEYPGRERDKPAQAVPTGPVFTDHMGGAFAHADTKARGAVPVASPVVDPTAGTFVEKYPVLFEIDELRCVVCGLCVEACPCDAIRMDTGVHVRPVYEREFAVLGKRDLMATPGDPKAEMNQPAYFRNRGGHGR